MEEGAQRRVADSRPTVDKAVEFRRLADQQLVPSYRLARAILVEHAEAEDAVHDAFLTAWHKWPSLRDPARFEAWFSRIVVNTCRDRLRRGARRLTTDIDEAPGVTATDDYVGVHERDQMSRAFARLEPDHRIVLVLRYYRDLKVDEIARLLDVRAGTVKSRLSRAQERMRAILSSYEAER